MIISQPLQCKCKNFYCKEKVQVQRRKGEKGKGNGAQKTKIKRIEKKRKNQGQILNGIHWTLQLIIISSIEPSPVENNDHMSLELPQLIIISSI